MAVSMVTKLVLMLIIGYGSSLRIFESTLPIDSLAGVSGLKYVPTDDQTDVRFTNSFTICARFNYQLLGNNAFLIDIVPKIIGSRDFFWFKINYPASWWGFGNSEKGVGNIVKHVFIFEVAQFHVSGYFSNWILQDPITDSFGIWHTYSWHHICITYDSTQSHITIAKVTKRHIKLVSICH